MDKITLSRRSVSEISQVIRAVFLEATSKREKLPVRFTYAMNRTAESLKAETAAVAAAVEPFEKVRNEIVKKLSVKDTDGKEIVETFPDGSQGYKIADPGAFEKELDAAQRAIAGYEDVEKLLEESVEVSVFKVDIADFPPSMLPYQMTILSALVKE